MFHFRPILSLSNFVPYKQYSTLNTKFKLRDGNLMPPIGMGTWKLDKLNTSELVYQAIKLGYRQIDCASRYGNEVEVGKGLQRAFSEKLVTREEMFITSKLWNTHHNPSHVSIALQGSLNRLGLDYLDLYLIHWPVSFEYDEKFVERDPNEYQIIQIPLKDTWNELRSLKEQKKIKSIGVSNFGIPEIQELTQDFGSTQIEVPAVNQIEFHPYLTQKALVSYCQSLGIIIQAYSPFASGKQPPKHLIPFRDHPLLNELASKYNKSPTQILLQWFFQNNVCPLPKSTSIEHLRENLSFLSPSYRLTSQEMEQINRLNSNHRFIQPNYWDFRWSSEPKAVGFGFNSFFSSLGLTRFVQQSLKLLPR